MSTLHFIHYIYLLCVLSASTHTHCMCRHRKTFFLRGLLPGVCYSNGKQMHTWSRCAHVGCPRSEALRQDTALIVWWVFSEESNVGPFKVVYVWTGAARLLMPGSGQWEDEDFLTHHLARGQKCKACCLPSPTCHCVCGRGGCRACEVALRASELQGNGPATFLWVQLVGKVAF